MDDRDEESGVGEIALLIEAAILIAGLASLFLRNLWAAFQ
jgi:hypothetical protein